MPNTTTPKDLLSQKLAETGQDYLLPLIEQAEGFIASYDLEPTCIYQRCLDELENLANPLELEVFSYTTSDKRWRVGVCSYADYCSANTATQPCLSFAVSHHRNPVF